MSRRTPDDGHEGLWAVLRNSSELAAERGLSGSLKLGTTRHVHTGRSPLIAALAQAVLDQHAMRARLVGGQVGMAVEAPVLPDTEALTFADMVAIQPREQHLAAIAKLHYEGHSLRSIAEIVGASHPEQIRRDLSVIAAAEAPVTRVTPARDRVRGRDGKSCPAVRARANSPVLAAQPTARRLSRGLTSSASVEWYMPLHVVERVVCALGAIDLDPCADPNRSIPAALHYTKADDGLNREWHGRVYMNPPYGREISKWVEKLAADFASGRVTQAVALVPARVDTGWWLDIPARSTCFVTGRLKFSDHENAAPFPSALLYLGDRPEAFEATFSAIGRIFRVAEATA